LDAAGSRFADLSHVEELGKYTTYSPTLYGLKEIRNLDLARIAVVGTPCQIHTIRKMQVLGVLPSHVVKFMIGLFCMENFSFDELARQKLEKDTCLACTDFANDFADISVGGLGSPEGYTTTMLRTNIGMKRYKEAVELGYIEEHKVTSPKELQVEKTKNLAKIINFAERKRRRGLATLSKI
jgi:coenzyme F420 hydrogenase subunit beta